MSRAGRGVISSDDVATIPALPVTPLTVAQYVASGIGCTIVEADPTGIVDATSTIQAAITAMSASGGVVLLRPGTYKCTAPITLSSNVALLGAGKGVTILDFSTYAGTGAVITATGSKGAVNLLTSNVAKGASVFAITDGTAFAAGDRVLLASEEAFRNFAGVTGYKGEIGIVDSVAVNNVTPKSPALDAYTVGANAGLSKLTMVQNISIRDLTIKRATQTATAAGGIAFNYVEHASITNVGVQYATECGIRIQNSLDVEVTGNSIEDTYYVGTGTSYAVIAQDASQNIRFLNNYMRKFRTAFTVGKGGAGIGGIPRLITFNNNTVIQELSVVTAGAIETHLVGEIITINGNTISAGGNGSFGIASDSPNTTISGNTIYGRQGITVGDSVTGTRTSGGIVVADNVIVMAGNSATAYGIRALTSHVKVRGNFITNDDAVANVGIGVYHPTANTAVVDVEIDGNQIVNSQAIAGAAYGIHTYGLQGGSITNNVIYRPGNSTAILLDTNGGTAVTSNVGVFSNTMIDDQAVPTMTYGLSNAASCTNIRYGGNTVIGATTGDVSAAVGTLATHAVGKPAILVGGSTVIGAGNGTVKMSSGNPGTNTAWIPYTYAGTVYYLPAWTTNAP